MRASNDQQVTCSLVKIKRKTNKKKCFWFYVFKNISEEGSISSIFYPRVLHPLKYRWGEQAFYNLVPKTVLVAGQYKAHQTHICLGVLQFLFLLLDLHFKDLLHFCLHLLHLQIVLLLLLCHLSKGIPAWFRPQYSLWQNTKKKELHHLKGHHPVFHKRTEKKNQRKFIFHVSNKIIISVSLLGERSRFNLAFSCYRCQLVVAEIFIVNIVCHILQILHMCSEMNMIIFSHLLHSFNKTTASFNTC